jgi:hypothetical protein
MDSHDLLRLSETVRTVWSDCEIQFLSLGFADDLEHVTVYVKPVD